MSDNPSRAELIQQMINTRKAKNETKDCTFYISIPDISNGLKGPAVDKVIAMLDKYYPEYEFVDTVLGSYNLDREWIETDSMPAAVEYSGVYPVEWDIDDIVTFEDMENSGEIIVRVVWYEKGEYIPNH